MTHVVSALFGAMLALLIYTRLGGMATVAFAAAILVAYIAWEAWRAFREWRAGELDKTTAYRHWYRWRNR